VAEQRRDSRVSKPSGDRRSSGAKKTFGSKPASRSAGSRDSDSRAAGGRSSTGKPAAKKASARRPADASSDRPKKYSDGPKKYADKKAAPSRGGAPAKKGAGSRKGAPAARSTSRPPREERARREFEPRTDDQAAYDGPDLPEHITGKELDRGVAAQLKGLPEKLAARVARHLAAAGYYIDDDPELAYQHAKAAKSRSQRIAVVREALGEAAYAAGHYAEALAELRAAKRMNGATAYLPIMADCHRALGHPQDAIKLAHSPSVVNFVPEAKAEMTLVEAGARRDMGQLDAALRVLEQAPLMHKSRAAWVVRLRYAYADTLEAAGRRKEALEWFNRTAGMDGEEITDALARAEQLSESLGDD